MLMIAEAAKGSGWTVAVAFERLPDTAALAQQVRDDLDAQYIDVSLGDEPQRRVRHQIVVTTRLIRRVQPDAALIVLPWPDRGLGCIIAAGLMASPAVVLFTLAPWVVGTARWGPLLRWAQRRQQRWVAVSNQNRRALATTFAVPETSIKTIYNGLPRRACPSQPERAEARAKLAAEQDLPSAARVLVTVGRLADEKGYRDLLEAVPRVLAAHPEAYFIWLGEGELRDQLERSILERGLRRNIRLLGQRQDVAAILRAGDLFVLPSHLEGLPFALLEAMQAGVPIVTSDAGGNCEVIRHGIDGLVHAAGNTRELGREIGWALDHPTQMHDMASSAYARLSSFSRDEMLRQSLDTLKDLRPARRRA